MGRGEKYVNPERGEEAIEKFKEHLVSSGLINDIAELKGRILVCHCAPHKPCHAEVLASYANNE